MACSGQLSLLGHEARLADGILLGTVVRMLRIASGEVAVDLRYQFRSDIMPSSAVNNSFLSSTSALVG